MESSSEKIAEGCALVPRLRVVRVCLGAPIGGCERNRDDGVSKTIL
jgi:hypothetical protein